MEYNVFTYIILYNIIYKLIIYSFRTILHFGIDLLGHIIAPFAMYSNNNSNTHECKKVKMLLTFYKKS